MTRRHAAHAAPRPASRALMRAALALSAAGAALAAGSAAAQAAPATPQVPGVNGVLGGAVSGLADSLGPVKHLRLNPMAGTTVNPLTNAVGTQIADFKPIGTQMLTEPLADGASLSQLPLVGEVSDLLPG